MATRTKDGQASGKEKRGVSPSATQNISVPQGRRTPKSVISESPSKDNSNISEKLVPHYLKPTISSSNEAHKHMKRSVSEGSSTRRLTTRRSFDKPQSPNIPKTPPSAGQREKLIKPSSPSSRIANSAKLVQGKTIKMVGRAKSMKTELGNAKKSDAKRTATCANSGHGQQEKEAAQDATVEALKINDEEHTHNEILHMEDQTPVNSEDIESNIFEKGVLDTCNTSSLLDEHELEHIIEEAPDGKHEESCEDKGDLEDKEGEQDEERLQDTDESPVKEADIVSQKQVNEKPPIETEVETTDSVDEVDKEMNDEGHEESTVKEMDRDMDFAPENTEPKADNVTPRRLDARAKKEAPAAYNDVIEETASKLKEQRKSKVMALAGAFETVISLQNHEGGGN